MTVRNVNTFSKWGAVNILVRYICGGRLMPKSKVSAFESHKTQVSRFKIPLASQSKVLFRGRGFSFG